MCAGSEGLCGTTEEAGCAVGIPKVFHSLFFFGESRSYWICTAPVSVFTFSFFRRVNTAWFMDFSPEYGGRDKKENKKRAEIWALKSFRDHSFYRMEGKIMSKRYWKKWVARLLCLALASSNVWCPFRASFIRP